MGLRMLKASKSCCAHGKDMLEDMIIKEIGWGSVNEHFKGYIPTNLSVLFTCKVCKGLNSINIGIPQENDSK